MIEVNVEDLTGKHLDGIESHTFDFRMVPFKLELCVTKHEDGEIIINVFTPDRNDVTILHNYDEVK